MSITSKLEAVVFIENLLGADGSRAIAERIVNELGWEEVENAAMDMGDEEWNSLLDRAAGVR
jgi:hypothetical protein